MKNSHPLTNERTAKKEMTKKTHTQLSKGLRSDWELRSLYLSTMPQHVTNEYMNKLPIEISLVMASRSMKKAGTATITKTIQDPFTGILVCSSISPNTSGTSPSWAWGTSTLG